MPFGVDESAPWAAGDVADRCREVAVEGSRWVADRPAVARSRSFVKASCWVIASEPVAAASPPPGACDARREAGSLVVNSLGRSMCRTLLSISGGSSVACM